MIDYDTSGQAKADQVETWRTQERFALTLDPTITDAERVEYGTFQPIDDAEHERIWALLNAAAEKRRARWTRKQGRSRRPKRKRR